MKTIKHKIVINMLKKDENQCNSFEDEKTIGYHRYLVKRKHRHTPGDQTLSPYPRSMPSEI